MQVQSAAPAATPAHVSSTPAPSGETQASPSNHVDEKRSGQTDPFTQAFNRAQDDISAREREAEAASQAAEAEEETAEQPGQVSAAQPAQEPVQPAAKIDLQAPSYWSKERRDAFRYQPRHVQEDWLAEEPAPNSRWSAEKQEAFNKLPREAKELYLTQITDIERGVNQKFQSLAAERKLAEDIRSAVPQHLRTYMEQKGLTEPQVFGHLLTLQQQSMQDPAGYVRQFIANNKLNPAELFGIEAQPAQPLTSEAIRAHPEYQQLFTQFDALRREAQQEREERAKEEGRRLTAEFDQIVSERDGDGEPLYPYIRLLADPMARIIDSDANSELFGSMSTRDRFAAAYRMALEEFPELKPLKRTVVPPPADEPVVKDAHTVDEERRAGNLERAITPKSRTPVPPMNGTGKTGDPLDDAIRGASRQLGLTR
jgi:hypothetical protein